MVSLTQKAIVLVMFTIFSSGCTTEDVTATRAPVYREQPYTLSDGTPCIILRGGTHSGVLSVTCDYSQRINPRDL